MEVRVMKSVGWVPLSLALLLLGGIIIVYVWAVMREDVSAWIPYISEAGGHPPQSGVFGIFLFCGSSLGISTMTLRYFIVADITDRSSVVINVFNSLSFLVGLLSNVGMFIVAVYPVGFNYDEKSEEWKTQILLPHSIGAFMLFIVGVAYTLLQTIITYFMYPKHNGLPVFFIRLACGVLSLASLITSILFV
ncbi:DNA damage-regulated autophagy modulator protein 1-like [Limulus polyphemus]|uniref:DNA damage-regulated autophagy modulator protein 1-like n=1 Tax=Limulus polyphemus TaxID=6850 RepID=A0ABM1SX90_LIMPO|nr:DNA damage-regulated autophagy modulator protein 1-like [Limulus polyphemus]